MPFIISSELTDEKLIQELATSDDYTTIFFAEGALEKRTATVIAQALSGISLKNIGLDLSACLKNRKFEELKLIFTSIPKHIIQLNISSNDLGNFKIDELGILFNLLSRQLTGLNISDNKLGNVDARELIKIFDALPPSIKWLELHNNSLKFSDCPDMSQIAGRIAKAYSFTIVGNDINQHLARLVGALSGLKSLIIDLKDVELGRQATQNAIASIFSAIPQGVEIIELFHFKWLTLSSDQIEKLLRAIPSHAKIKIEANELDKMKQDDLLAFINSLPSTTILDTSNLQPIKNRKELQQIISTAKTAGVKLTFSELENTGAQEALEADLDWLCEHRVDKLLKTMESKIAKYKASDIQSDKDAADAAQTLYNSILAATESFLDSKELIDNKGTSFKAACQKAFIEPRKVLEQHRDWKEVIAEIFSLIISISSLGIANYVTGTSVWGLFHIKTDFEQHLDEVASLLKI